MDGAALTTRKQQHSRPSQDNDRQVAATIARLLLHYWAPGDLSDEARKAMAADWLEDLSEFGPDVVGHACREWRRKPINRRPLPGEIRALCIERKREVQERVALAGPTNMDEYARSVGWANNAERMEAIAKDQAKAAGNYERMRLLGEEMRLAPVGPLRTAAQALGVTAREFTAEDLRAGRIALGLEREPEPVVEEE